MPAPAIMAALFSAGAGIAGQAMTNSANAQATQANNDTQIRLAREADERNYRLWNATNIYNSPVEQRRRLMQAGLNPGLMYGGIDNTAGLPADSNVPETSAAQREFNVGSISGLGQMADILNDNNALNTRIKEAQARSLEIENDIKEERRPLELKNLELAGENLAKDLEIKSNKESRDAEEHLKKMSKYDEEIRKLTSDANLSEATFKEFEKLAPYRERKAQLENDLLSERIEGQRQSNRITKMQADQAAKEIAAIELLNYQMAEDKFLIDTYFNDYLNNNKEYKFVFWEMRWKDDGYSKSTITNPQAWVEALGTEQRYVLLQRGNWFKDKKYLDKPYQNLYYSRQAKSGLSPVTTGFFNVSNNYSNADSDMPNVGSFLKK